MSTPTTTTNPSKALTIAGVVSLIAAAIAFGVVQSQAHQRETNYQTGRVSDALSGLSLSADHVAGGNYTAAIALAVIGVVLITWGLLARRP